VITFTPTKIAALNAPNRRMGPNLYAKPLEVDYGRAPARPNDSLIGIPTFGTVVITTGDKTLSE
jgi:hypothetical protein